MDSAHDILRVFREAGEINVVQILAILISAWVVLLIDQRILPKLARGLPGRIRVHVLALIPTIRLVVLVVASILILRRIVEPTVENMVALFGLLGIGLGFALKDYATSLIAGTMALYEMPYRPGDWITVDGVYGQVRNIEFRAVHIVTPDDTLVIIPHNKLWNSLVHNANNGSTKLQCVANFYLDPDHDGAVVRRRLRDVALTSPYIQLSYDPIVVSSESPWGTHYRVRAYPIDPDQQFTFVTDLTERGKASLIALGVSLATVNAVAR